MQQALRQRSCVVSLPVSHDDVLGPGPRARVAGGPGRDDAAQAGLVTVQAPSWPGLPASAESPVHILHNFCILEFGK